MPDSLKLRNEPITQAMFDRLPALLTAHQVKLVTGLDDHELAAAVKGKRIKIYRRPVRSGCKRSYLKYFKTSLGPIAGFKT